MQKQIKIALALFIFSALFCMTGVILSSNRMHLLSKGTYFFENTRQNNNINKIILSFPNGKKISFFQKNNLWRIEEVDDYFASFSKIDSLFKLLRDTTIFRTDALDEKVKNSIMTENTSIKTFDDKGNLVDEASIAPKKENNKYHYAILNGKPFLHQINGNYAISSLVMDWIQPLPQIESSKIKNIKTDNFDIYRQHTLDKFKNSKDKQQLFHADKLVDHILNLPIEDIKHTANFSHKTFIKVKHYDITLFNGIIYEMNIFSDDIEYWASIKLNQENLISTDVSNFLEEKNLLFDGWYFKIDKDVGESLRYFVL